MIKHLNINSHIKRILIAFLLFIAAGGLGYYMYTLTRQEVLWGYLPLYWFLLVWAGVVMLTVGKKYTENPMRWRWLTLALLTGLFLWLGFTPMPFLFMMAIAYVPLLILESEIAQSDIRRKGKAVFWYSYIAFVLWNILSTFWVTNSAFTAGIFAIFVNAFLMCLPIWLYHKTRKVMQGKLAFVAFIAYWITFEYLHMRWDLTWPWLTLGNSLSTFPALAQWYEYTGVFGGSLWTLTLNVLIFKWTRDSRWPKATFPDRRDAIAVSSMNRNTQWALIRIGLILIVPIIFSLAIYYTYMDKGSLKEVVVVQPNIEPHYGRKKLNEEERVRRHFLLAKEALTEKSEYLVFPESAFRSINIGQKDRMRSVLTARNFLQQYPNVKLITGIGAYRIMHDVPTDSMRQTIGVRINENGDTAFFWEAYNAAAQLTESDRKMPIYIKGKLVPGAEIFPYYDLLFFLKPIVDALDGTVQGNGRSKERMAFTNNGYGIAPVICYESIFGEYTTGYIKKGAHAIFIVTNDGWWSKTAGHRQHLQFCTLRAIETRRSIARSAITGISCFVNQRGDIQQPTGYEVEAAIRQDIAFNNTTTFYTKWGDLIGRVALFLGIVLGVNVIVKYNIQKNHR